MSLSIRSSAHCRSFGANSGPVSGGAFDPRNGTVGVMEVDRILGADPLRPHPAGTVRLHPGRTVRLQEEERNRAVPEHPRNPAQARCLPLRIRHRHGVHGARGVPVQANKERAALGACQRSDIDEAAGGIEGYRGEHADARVPEPQSPFVLGRCRAQPERAVADIRADPEQAIRAKGEAAGIDQVARALSLAAEAEEEAAAGIEDPDFVGLDVGDDDPAARSLPRRSRCG